MKKITYVLSGLVLILSLWAVALWVLPIGKYNNVTSETRYGTSEGMQLVEQAMTNGERQYVVEDVRGLQPAAKVSRKEVRLPAVDVRTMAHNSPFYAEASKIISGKLEETDATRRRQILNYCEHLRTAYTTKDIDFLRQVFSDDALIIVGNVVRQSKDEAKVGADSRVSYALHSKADYLSRLSKVFGMNKKVDVRFSDFRIMRHPTKDGIYGVSLRQRYKSDRYADDGWLFLLWDFHNASMPLIHVRTWQPSATVSGSDGVIEISDFNLE